jgi:hypothetical protein
MPTKARMPRNAPAHHAPAEEASAEGALAEGMPAETPADDPLAAKIERILAQFKDLVPPEDLAFMRDMMRLYGETHPDMATLVDRLRKRAPVARSTVRTRPDAAPQTTRETERSGVGPSPTRTRRQKKASR